MFVLGPNQEIKYHVIHRTGTRSMRKFMAAIDVDNRYNYNIKPVEVCVLRDPWERFVSCWSRMRHKWRGQMETYRIPWDDPHWMPQHTRRWHHSGITYFRYNKHVNREISLLFQRNCVIINTSIEIDTMREQVSLLNDDEMNFLNSIKDKVINEHFLDDYEFYNSTNYYNI